MLTSICLIACSLTVTQSPDQTEWRLAPQLVPGLELMYSGTYLEEALGPNVNYQRRYHLETVLFVLEAEPRRWDIAFMTSLNLSEPSKEAKSAAKEAPTSVRLELASVDAQGQLQGNALLAPIAGPPTIECGFVVETPVLKVGLNQVWEVSDPGRPPRTWRVMGTELCNGVTCVKLTGAQQSEDWDRPRGDHTAWRRIDATWIHPQLGVAQKVERTIERRQPAHVGPTERTTVRFELDSRPVYPSRLRDDRRQEILKAKKFQDEAAPLLAQPAQHRPQIDSLLKRISNYVDSQSPTPYRKATVSLRGRLERARRGEAPAEAAVELEPFTTATRIGDKVPDFLVTDLTGKESVRLTRMLGRPVFIFFYNPATSDGKEVLRFAQDLSRQFSDRLCIMAMAVTHDPESARKQHADLGLPFPILDGKGLHQTFGVDGTPRLIVLDSEGVLRCGTTGWGIQTPGEIRQELARCMTK